MKTLEVDYDEYDEDYIFNVGTKSEPDVNIKIEGKTVKFLRDTGASVNIIDQATYTELKKQVNIKLHPTKARIFSYGAREAIKLEGVFYANINYGTTHNLARIHVASHKNSGCILGRETSVELGLIQISETVNSVQFQRVGINQQIKNEFPTLFEGLGKLKDVEIKFNINPEVPPVSQHLRRIPFHVRKKVEKKLDQLLELDVIEKVTGPTSWVSPIVAVPKGEEVRLTIDMRQANQAILRNHYPIPTIEELLQQFNNCKLFSKIDLNKGYHQISLHPESRKLTTFITHAGVFQYKRLVQGANTALEEYQRAIRNLFIQEELIANISDDILIAGRTEQEHDSNLRKCLNILKENNLTINEKKCVWKVPEIIFFGICISAQGIQPTTSKVAAVNAFPSPKTVKEVSSFLGLVTYLARFIPNLSTESAPLRKLLMKDAMWKWEREEEEAFKKSSQQFQSNGTF